MSYEIFYAEREECGEPTGWYWQALPPYAVKDSKAWEPFSSYQEAEEDARGDK